MEANNSQVIVLPRHWDVLRFTLEADKTGEPVLTVGNATLYLDQLSPPHPRLILSLKRNHVASSRLVSLAALSLLIITSLLPPSMLLISTNSHFAHLQLNTFFSSIERS